jgi:hypothetical protein
LAYLEARTPTRQTLPNALSITALPITALSITALPITELPITELPITELPIDALPIDELPIDALPERSRRTGSNKEMRCRVPDPSAAAVLLGGLFGFVGFEEGSGLFEIEKVSVYDHLVFASVFRDVDDVLNSMALVSQGGDEKIDIYHALEFTGSSFWESSDG